MAVSIQQIMKKLSKKSYSRSELAAALSTYRSPVKKGDIDNVLRPKEISKDNRIFTVDGKLFTTKVEDYDAASAWNILLYFQAVAKNSYPNLPNSKGLDTMRKLCEAFLINTEHLVDQTHKRIPSNPFEPPRHNTVEIPKPEEIISVLEEQLDNSTEEVDSFITEEERTLVENDDIDWDAEWEKDSD